MQRGAASSPDPSVNGDSSRAISREQVPRALPQRGGPSRLGVTGPFPCAFCDDTTANDLLVRSFTAVALPDAHPVSPGHTLIIPRRHVRNVFELGTDEYNDLWGLVRRVREMLARHYTPDGMTVGCNDGEAAGQTVEHAHVHVIPRFQGDVKDPRGGIRWVIPRRARYWRRPIEHPEAES